MADAIGRVPVPAPVKSGVTFNLKSEFGYGVSQDFKIVEHRFGELATLAVQRYAVGSGARRFQFVKSVLNYKDRQYLLDFYNSVQGSYQSFTYPVPNTVWQGAPPPGVTDPVGAAFTNVEVVFDVAPLSATELANHTQTGLTFLEIIDPANAFVATVGGVFTRFPNDALAQALASQVQVIIPLIHIKVRNSAVPDIYLSDRRVVVNGFPGAPSPTTFLARLQGVGVPGTSDVIMSQSIDGRSENVRFVFGNADRAMTKLINDCSLEYAQIDLSLFHVGTASLLQMWKGVIISWQADGSAQFSVQCSDGLYPVTQAYPPRTVSRQCWKPFNTDVVPGYRPCPWATAGGGVGNATSCDFFFNSPNGCLSHNMSPYFGGHPEQPQSVVIKDNGTGIIGGFFRSTVTSTSILSDSIWGKPLPEIWCNSLGSPQRAFWAQCMIAAVREESTFEDILGIIGAGPIGAFEGMSVQTNSDGYKFAVAPTADGFFPQGFQLDGYLNITGYQPTLGLRQSLGNDPAHLGTAVTDGIDAFSLGQGTPQHWDESDPTFSNVAGRPKTIIPYAAGTALCEVRYLKSAGQGLAPTTAESHNLQCPIRQGLTGYVWSTSDVRTAVPGLINPFWVAANTYFRALGIQQASAATQLAYIVRDSITNAAGMGCADIAGLQVDPVVGSPIPAYQITAAGQALFFPNLDYFNNTFNYRTSITTVVSLTLAQAVTAGYIVQIGTLGKEPQFMFQGTLAEFKPFRDWMIEILNCCLGFFCFEFGKLKMGIRYSAVPTDSFTVGSMLYQSLSITPISAGFEYLKVSFANVELQYQQDLAEYQDKDHALYYGRPGSPLASDMRSVGCSTLSQGLRIGVSRTREEIGGILRKDLSNPYVEWDNHKRIAFKSTLLALNNEIGQVVGVQHPDLPTYPGAAPGSRAGSNGPFAANTWPFRIQKWMLHSDWSVSILADSCVDSMYDLEVGPQPEGVGPRPLPVLFFPEPLGQWAPYQIQADPADALYPSEFSFNLEQTFDYGGDGLLLTSAMLAGVLPVNQFVPNCGAPDVKKGGVTWAATGGSIPGGITIFVQISAAIVDATPTVKQYSPPSEILVLQTPIGTNTNALTLNNIKWPPVAALNGWVLFAGTSEDLICGQQSGLGQPASITFIGSLARQTYAVPDFDVSILRLRAQVLVHGGVLGAGVDSLTATTIVSGATADLASPPPITAASAVFRGFDAATQGNWKGVYGQDGGNMQGETFAWPSYITSAGWQGAVATFDFGVDAIVPQKTPQKPGASDPTVRTGHVYYTPTDMHVDLVVTDGLQHTLALYCFNPEGNPRHHTVQITDLAGNILDASRLMDNIYLQPKWAVWTITGSVRLSVHNLSNNSVLQGLFFSPVASAAGTDNWAGRVLAIIGRQGSDGIAPWAHFNITAFNAATGTYTLDRSPVAAGVLPGDVFVVCTLGVDNSANPYVISDPGLSNASNIPPHTGEAANDPERVGQMIRVIKGLNRGASAKIVSNTATSYTLDQPLLIDATSVWIICDPGWNYSKDVVINNADPGKTTLSAIEIDNYKGLPLLVEGVTIDSEGQIVDDANACVRMLFIPGVQGTTTVTT